MVWSELSTSTSTGIVILTEFSCDPVCPSHAPGSIRTVCKRQVNMSRKTTSNGPVSLDLSAIACGSTRTQINFSLRISQVGHTSSSFVCECTQRQREEITILDLVNPPPVWKRNRAALPSVHRGHRSNLTLCSCAV